MTRSKSEIAQHAAGLACSRLPSGTHPWLARTIREIIAEAWQGGRDEAGRELAGILGGLIDDGVLTSPQVISALGALIPSPDPGSHSARLEDAAGHEPLRGIVVHIRSVSANGRDVEREQAAARAWHDRGYSVAPVPADGRDHPYGQVCPVCSADPGRVHAVRQDAPALLTAFGKNWPYLARAREGPDPQERAFPLSDAGAGAEAQADAAERLAGFGWAVTGTRPPGLTADQERLFRELTGDPDGPA